MIQNILRGSHWLDAWLREHLGRPYLAILGIGLVLGIIAAIQELVSDIGSDENVVKLLLAVAFQAALLINQLAQFHDYREERRLRREAKARKGEAGSAQAVVEESQP